MASGVSQSLIGLVGLAGLLLDRGGDGHLKQLLVCHFGVLLLHGLHHLLLHQQRGHGVGLDPTLLHDLGQNYFLLVGWRRPLSLLLHIGGGVVGRWSVLLASGAR